MGRGVSGLLVLTDFRSASAKGTYLECEKFTMFPYGQYINGIVIKMRFKNLLCYEVEVSIYEKFAKI